MKITDLIIPIIFAYLTVWGVQYYFGWGYVFEDNCPEKTEQHFIAPTEQKTYKPLKKDIDFLDSHMRTRPKITTVNTNWGTVEFSSFGASIESIEYVRDNNACPVRTIFPLSSENNQQRALLVALKNETPTAYALIDQKIEDDVTILSYEVKTKQASIVKTFNVDHKKHLIDLTITITPHGDTLDYVRIFWPSPIMSEAISYNVTSGIFVDNAGSFSKTALSSLNMQQGWFEPQIFGTDNKYFLHALVSASESAVARAYYKAGDADQFTSIVEIPEIIQKTTMNFSFYFGPKELDALVAVDNRLEKTLDFSGLLFPISKLILKLLKWLYQYLQNFGLAIIALTFLMKLVLLPITMYGEKAMRQQQAMQAKMAYVKQKYKNDPERSQLEQTKLIKQEGIAGLGGCLGPMVINMLMFFVLRTVLNSSMEMYQAPFLWIKDLSATDPYYLLPILTTLLMLVQFGQNADAKKQVNSFIMAIVFGAFSTVFSAGLALYFAMSTLFGILQTRLVKTFSK